LREAGVAVEDRGFQFADGVYEFWSVLAGRLADGVGHLDRLDRSLDELRIPRPMSRTALIAVLREVVRRNALQDGSIYLQVTRGAARRDHPFPSPAPRPTLAVIGRPMDMAALETRAQAGVAVLTQPDIRWGRCDIKSVALLPNVLAKQTAREAGAFEAWLVDRDGLITEGASTNAWILDQAGRLRTRGLDSNILRGITRHTLIEIARQLQIEVVETAFSVEEAQSAREAFFTAASAFLTPVVEIDGHRIGDGRPGPVSLRLRALYLQHAAQYAL
jgi:D-alanine transaminase